MNFWLWLTIWVGSSLMINYTIEAFVTGMGGSMGYTSGGYQLYPSWLVEAHYAYFWYAAVLRWLMNHFGDPTATLDLNRVGVNEFKGMISYCLGAHIVASLVLRLLGVYWFFAYVAPFAVTVLLPVGILQLTLPYFNKRGEQDRINPAQLGEIAQSHPAAQRFLAAFPHAAAYVYDQARRFDQAFCLWLARFERDELPGLQEDIVLEIPVHMGERRVIEESIVLSRYLFLEGQEGAAVHHLPTPTLETLETCRQPLDPFDIDKIESAVYRHPSLQEIPLPLATRGVSYERLAPAYS
mgnify:CR=1 FL=1